MRRDRGDCARARSRPARGRDCGDRRAPRVGVRVSLPERPRRNLRAAARRLARALRDGTFVADLLSATMAAITGVIGLATAVYSRASDDLSPACAPFYRPLLLVMLGGIAGGVRHRKYPRTCTCGSR